jgi:hypothetical protein
MQAQYQIYSYLGKKEFQFIDKTEANIFFDQFIGNAIMMSEGKEIRKKNTIKSHEDLIHASIFLQHGITRDGTNVIIEKFLVPPSSETIDNFSEAMSKFSEPGKGIGIFGQPGVGKTTIIRFLRMSSDAGYISAKGFEKVTVRDIVTNFKQYGSEVFSRLKLDAGSRINICIDDLGRDNGMRMLYGDRVNVLADILESRYDAYIDYGLLTHFTTNFNEEELQKLYDPNGILSNWGRLCEMCNFLVIEDKNFRIPEI